MTRSAQSLDRPFIAANALMAVTLNLCGECEKVATAEAWQEAWWKLRSRRIGQVRRGEVDAVDLGWLDPDDPKSEFTSSYGLDDRMVCPHCGYVHSDDENSYVEERSGFAVELPPARDLPQGPRGDQ